MKPIFEMFSPPFQVCAPLTQVACPCSSIAPSVSSMSPARLIPRGAIPLPTSIRGNIDTAECAFRPGSAAPIPSVEKSKPSVDGVVVEWLRV